MPDKAWYNQNTYFPDEPQSLSKNNWVCLTCRAANRRPKLSEHTPKCADCHADMICIGSRMRLPKKTDKKAWTALAKRVSPTRD